MAMDYVMGSPNPVTTGETSVYEGSRDAGSVTVEGPYALVKSITNFASLVPSGTTPNTHHVSSDGHGGGKLVVNWINYGQDGGLAATEDDISWRIEMSEVQTPLQNHPDIPKADRIEIVKWLGTDLLKRFNPGNNAAQWVDENGTATPVAQPYALKFVECYLRGIETYNRYFPVMEKISSFKRLPGASMIDNKTTGGTASKFSSFSQIGTFSVPDLKLSGYADGGWFKSGDGYSRNGGRVWTRTEQWTWTPDYNDSNVNWIYSHST